MSDSLLFKMSRLLGGLAIVVSLLGLSNLGQAQTLSSGVPQTSLVFQQLYIKQVLGMAVLSSYQKPETQKILIVRQALEHLREFVEQKPLAIPVRDANDFSDYLDKFSGNRKSLPDFESALKENRLPLPPNYVVTAPTPRVETMIYDVYEAHIRQFGDWQGMGLSQMDALDSPKVSQRMASILNSGRGVVYDNMMILYALNLSHQKLEKELSSFDNLYAESNLKQLMRTDDVALNRFFEVVIGEYFRNLKTSYKLEIFATLLNQSVRLDEKARLQVIFQHCGPQFQKLFQVFARNPSFDPAIRQVFSSLESAGSASPISYVRQEIARSNEPYKWRHIEAKPLGVGSMAQNHRASIEDSQGQRHRVAVRVLKEGMPEKLAEDARILFQLSQVLDQDPLLKAAKFPQITPLVQDIVNMTQDELNVGKTIRAQQEAHSVYNRKSRYLVLRVPRVFNVDPNSSIMIQEYVNGMSLENYAKSYPQKARFAVEALGAMWIEEAFLGSGFFHADLHQGNVLVSVGGAAEPILNLLDFGMSGKLDAKLQVKLLGLFAVVETGQVSLIVRALEAIIEGETMAPHQRETLRSRLMEIRRISPTRTITADDCLRLAIEMGLKIPKELVSLERGFTLVSKMLVWAGSDFDLSAHLRQAVMKSPRMKLALTSHLVKMGAGHVTSGLSPRRIYKTCVSLFQRGA